MFGNTFGDAIILNEHLEEEVLENVEIGFMIRRASWSVPLKFLHHLRPPNWQVCILRQKVPVAFITWMMLLAFFIIISIVHCLNVLPVLLLGERKVWQEKIFACLQLFNTLHCKTGFDFNVKEGFKSPRHKQEVILSVLPVPWTSVWPSTDYKCVLHCIFFKCLLKLVEEFLLLFIPK